MGWLMSPEGGSYSDQDACSKVGSEFPSDCGACNPTVCNPVLVDPPNASNLVWSDEFGADGLPDTAKWGYDTGGDGWGNNELQYYTDRIDNAYISQGVLHIRSKREDYDGRTFTSARLVTKTKGDWEYGRMAVRARLRNCTGLGTWPAIWMLPTDWVYGDWPASGEIDIMEHVGYDTGSFHGTVHTEAYNHMIGTQRGGGIFKSVDEWHEFEVIWTPDKIDFVIDGTIYYEFARDSSATYREWPFDQKFHLILNVAVGGSWGGAQGVDDAAFEGDGQVMEVDWVRVYSE